MSLSIALLSLFLLTPAPNAAPKKTCTLRSTHGTPVLLGDAWSQKIAVVADSCDKLVKNDYLLVNSADSKLRAPVAYDGTNLAMTAPIPAPGDAGSAVSSTWLLYPSEGAMSSGAPSLGQVIMAPVTVKVSSRTVVHYPDDPMLTETLARARKPAGIAYANRTFEVKQADGTVKIINHAAPPGGSRSGASVVLGDGILRRSTPVRPAGETRRPCGAGASARRPSVRLRPAQSAHRRSCCRMERLSRT